MVCQYCSIPFGQYDCESFVVDLAAHFSGVSYSCPGCYLLNKVGGCAEHDRAIIELSGIGDACTECVEHKAGELGEDINVLKLHNPEYRPFPGQGIGCLQQPRLPAEERELLLYNLKLRTGGPTIFPFCFLVAMYMLTHSIEEVSLLLEEIDARQSLRGIFPDELFKNPIAPG